jgi:hypothetical protein
MTFFPSQKVCWPENKSHFGSSPNLTIGSTVLPQKNPKILG